MSTIALRVGDARQAVRVVGDGPPVVLLHGGGPGTSSHGWGEVAERLSSRWQVFSPDHLGFGGSDAPDAPYGTPFFAERLLALLDVLCLPRVALIGHSMGAQVAIRAAMLQRSRVSHIGLVAPGGHGLGIDHASPGLDAIGAFAAGPTEDAMRRLVGLMHDTDATGLEAEVARRLDIVRRPGLLAAQRVMAQSRQSRGAAKPVRQALEQLGIPMLLLWGLEERFNPPGIGPAMRDALPAGTAYREIAGAGHGLPEEKPDETAAAIAAFIGGGDVGGAGGE